MSNVQQKITPSLWFDREAEEAAHFYTGIFPDSAIGNALRNNEDVVTIDFTLGGQRFSALNGGPQFKFNPSVSFYVVCETEAEVDRLWEKLSDGGTTLIPLGRFDWSPKFGWVQDRYGLGWQIALGKLEETGQKISPFLLFAGAQRGQAAVAAFIYTQLFPDSGITGILPFKEGEEGPAGMVKHAQFRLQGHTFMAMDHPLEEDFSFNEALSFVVHCATQEEVDYYWEQLTADGGAESQCGWLKDRFGVSWQIIPEALPRLLADPDPVKAQTAMAAMLNMRKIDIEKLTQAPEKTTITIETTVQLPIEKVWERWTEAGHVQHWNNASDDWHTPQAANDLRAGGRFVYTMAARDGSFSFDFEGIYDEVLTHKRIAYTMTDGRKVAIDFKVLDGGVHITEAFEAETLHSHEMQRSGWQAILDNFKRYAEALG